MTDIAGTLPSLHRLALAYAPGRAPTATLGLLAFDARMASTIREASEPMLAQIRLAWWREMLAQPPLAWPKGEPLVAVLVPWEKETGALASLIDGWEHLAAADKLDEAAMRAFAAARGQAFAALARLLGREDHADRALQMGTQWALADLASRLDQPDEARLAGALLADQQWTQGRLPRALRPLAVLHGLAARASRKGERLSEPSRGALFTAIRIGLFGR